MNKNIKVIQYRIISDESIRRCPDDNLFSLYNIKERSRKRIYYRHLLSSSFNQETSKYFMTCQTYLSPESRTKTTCYCKHVVPESYLWKHSIQKVIYENIVNKVIYGNIINMMLKIIEHPIYVTISKIVLDGWQTMKTLIRRHILRRLI